VDSENESSGLVLSSYCLLLCCVEDGHIFKKVLKNLAHLPTIMLIIGFPVYWVELYFFRRQYGQTTLVASFLFIAFCVVCWVKNFESIKLRWQGPIKCFYKWDGMTRFLFLLGGVLTLLIIFLAFYAALLPPHLMQEFDALNYHITLPRQHLMLGNFSHIQWSTADLYFLPLDYALAPYWLVTKLPNKFPQFLFFLGLLFISFDLVGKFTRNNLRAQLLVVLSIVGSHIVGIQAGTAMLDIVMCYLLFAALESFLSGRIFLSAIELAFYFWSKSFIPIQTILVLLVVVFFGVFLKRPGFDPVLFPAEANAPGSLTRDFKRDSLKFFSFFVLISLFVAGPFAVKSLKVSGTPLYPFGIGWFDLSNEIDRDSRPWESLTEQTKKVLATKDQYGSGRSPLEFIRHVWLIAVPEKNVNNRYDYPVGLVYLLCLGPFVLTLLDSFKKKQYQLLPIIACVFWLTWWMGSHQSRFLFIPIILMILVVVSQNKYCTKTFVVFIIFSLLLTSLSVFRAHRKDFLKNPMNVLRQKDKTLLEMSNNIDRSRPVILDYYDVAFADFLVDVKNNESVFVLKY